MARDPILFLLLLVVSAASVAALHVSVSSVPDTLDDHVNLDRFFGVRTTWFLTTLHNLSKYVSDDLGGFLKKHFGTTNMEDLLRNQLWFLPLVYNGYDPLSDQGYYAVLVATILIDIYHIERDGLDVGEDMDTFKHSTFRNVIGEKRSRKLGGREYLFFEERRITSQNTVELLDFYFLRVYGARLHNKGTRGLQQMVVNLVGYLKFRAFWTQAGASFDEDYIKNAKPLNLLHFPTSKPSESRTVVEEKWKIYFSDFTIRRLAAELCPHIENVPFRMQMYQEWRKKNGQDTLPETKGIPLDDCAGMLYLLNFSQHPAPSGFFIRTIADLKWFIELVVDKWFPLAASVVVIVWVSALCLGDRRLLLVASLASLGLGAWKAYWTWIVPFPSPRPAAAMPVYHETVVKEQVKISEPVPAHNASVVLDDASSPKQIQKRHTAGWMCVFLIAVVVGVAVVILAKARGKEEF